MADLESLAGGRYLLVKKLGEGGMATVYRAFDQRLQVWRAIKVLLPDFTGKKKIIARFEAEAQTMALLEHPHIVRVYDVDREGGHAYIVMELVEGGALTDWLESHGRMPARMAVDCIVEMCQALQFAHDKGVIHRDIKPHNVMIDRDGICRVTDFGIARAGDTDNALTKTGAVMGTWGFMAPEQRTDAKHVDARADVYAIAATLYSLITDQTPMDLFVASRDASLLEGVPEPLVPVLVKATEYHKEDRYGSADEFAAALLAVRDALPEDPVDTPPRVGDVSPLPPPPTRAEEADEAPAGRAGQPTQGTILPPDDPAAAALGGAAARTMAPGFDDDDPAAVPGQERSIYVPVDDPVDGPPPTRAGPDRRVWGLALAGVGLALGAVGLAVFGSVVDLGGTGDAPTPITRLDVPDAPPGPDAALEAAEGARIAVVFQPSLPAAVAHPPHAPERFDADVPEDGVLSDVVLAATRGDCDASLRRAVRAAADDDVYAGLVDEAWACFDTALAAPLAEAEVETLAQLGRLLPKLQGDLAPPDRPAESGAMDARVRRAWLRGQLEDDTWFGPTDDVGGLDARLVRWSVDAGDPSLPELSVDRLGDAAVADALGRDVALEAAALSALLRTPDLPVPWLIVAARRAFVLKTALEGPVGEHLDAHESPLVRRGRDALALLDGGEGVVPDAETLAVLREGVGAAHDRRAALWGDRATQPAPTRGPGRPARPSTAAGTPAAAGPSTDAVPATPAGPAATPPPPKAEQCLKGVTVAPAGGGAVRFTIGTCLGQGGPDVVLHYKLDEGPWLKKRVTFALGGFRANLPTQGAAEVRYYVTSDGKSWPAGGQGAAKTYAVGGG